MDLTFPRVSWAQNGEDIRLWRALQGISRGTYVEVGGWMPETHSVTRFFYGQGWSGTVFEPVPELAQGFASARPRDNVVNAAVGACSGVGLLYAIPGTGLSTLCPDHAARHAANGYPSCPVEVPIVSLELSLAGHVDPVHFMVIDVEGSEGEVLSGANFEVLRPWILVIESTDPLSSRESYATWEPALTAAPPTYRMASSDWPMQMVRHSITVLPMTTRTGKW